MNAESALASSLVSSAPRPSASRAASWRRALREPLRVTVGLLLAAILCDAFLLGGLLRQTSVVSGSMAPTLLGPHHEWKCTRCAQVFACNEASLPDGKAAARCPWCDQENSLAASARRPGQRLLIDRVALMGRAPRRWEVVVARAPRQASEWCIKRIVGLPGESVALRNGDVWIDGRRAAKSLDELRAMAIRVTRGDGLARDWVAEAAAWQWDGSSAAHESSRRRVAWLQFRPARKLTDESPCDQNESRVLNPVGDLLLACDVRTGVDGVVCLRMQSHGAVFDLELDAQKRTTRLRHNGRTLASEAYSPDESERWMHVELAVADGRVHAALDGEESASCEFDSSNKSAAPATLSIEASGRVELRRPEVFRDVYYTASSRGDGQYRLGADEYFVLSDNSPHGADSRDWAPADKMIGDLLVGLARWW